MTPDIYKDTYVEKIWNLPDIWCTLSTSDIKNIEPSYTPAIKNNYITFGSFNNIQKINNTVIKVWSKILFYSIYCKANTKKKVNCQYTMGLPHKLHSHFWGACKQELL